VTNIFLFDYAYRLKSWAELRKTLKDSDLAQQCIEVDRFWQKTPMIDHYLHTDFINDWPTPWQLLNDNTYCDYARALGMIYTLLLLDSKNIELVDAKDDNSNEVALVLVDSAKYVLNYWPETVVNNHIADFEIIRKHDITPLLSKIG
jgi:hypothetical protein